MADTHVCVGDLSGWREMFNCISPYSWGYMGVAIALTFSIIGAAWYVHYHIYYHWVNFLILCFSRGIFLTGTSLVGSAIKMPRIKSKNLIR